MAANPQGKISVTANGKPYTLHVGLSVLADLQSKHGQDVLEKIDPPDGAGANWMPDLSITYDLFAGALERYHPGEADRWLVDDIVSQNAGAMSLLMSGSLPDAPQDTKQGNVKRARRAS